VQQPTTAFDSGGVGRFAPAAVIPVFLTDADITEIAKIRFQPKDT
jgi:hypothetical protein